MSRVHRTRKGYVWGDSYAADALGIESGRSIPSIGEGMIEAAVREFTYRVFPLLSKSGFSLQGQNPHEVEAVHGVLFSGDIWTNHDMTNEFQAYVDMIATHGHLYVHFALENLGPDIGTVLLDLKWLAPETMVRRRNGDYEQFVTSLAAEGEGYSVSGGPREYYFTFSPEEMFHLEWPRLDDQYTVPPAIKSRPLATRLDHLQRRHLLALSAVAYPEETFWTLSRGRAGAYSDSLEQEQSLEAAIYDAAFVVPDVELTQHFFVDRLIRSRLTAIEVRQWVLDQFTESVLRRWCELNGWAPIRLVFESDGWTSSDWAELRDAYLQGTARFEDVGAAIEAERL